jgi:hypothetical protein
MTKSILYFLCLPSLFAWSVRFGQLHFRPQKTHIIKGLGLKNCSTVRIFTRLILERVYNQPNQSVVMRKSPILRKFIKRI